MLSCILHNARCRTAFRMAFLAQYAFFIWVQLFHNLDICNPFPSRASSAYTKKIDKSGKQIPVKVRLNKRYQHVEAELSASAPEMSAPAPVCCTHAVTREQVKGHRSFMGPDALRGPPSLS